METKTLACRLMGITELEYEMKLFNQAMEYLKVKFADDVEAQTRLNQSPVFWKWWKLQWEGRTKVMLEHFNFNDRYMNPSEIVRKRSHIAYDHCHRIDKIANTYSRSVLRESFRTHKKELVKASNKSTNK